MKKQPIRHQIDGLIALLLFGVFSVCILAVLLTGADAYRRLTDRDQAAFDRRTVLQYIATRVRQADQVDGVRVADFNGVDALVFDDGDGYVTRVYCYDGKIMELYAEEYLDMGLESGEAVMEAEPLEFSMEDGRLTVSNGEDSLVLSLRSGEGGGTMTKSKAPLVMLEQMVMLLVFALAAALCLQAFVKSDAASRESEARDRAAVLCQSMAEVMRTNGGDALEAARTVLGDGWLYDPGQLTVPLDEDMTPLAASKPPYEDAPYRLEVSAPSYQDSGLSGAHIQVKTAGGEELFSLEVLWQVEVTA